MLAAQDGGPRIAILHTWLTTQDEGWWRMALDSVKVPFDYISTQDVAKISDLNAKYDVLVFVDADEVGPGDQTNMVFMNTPVTHGSGVIVVTGTGADTLFALEEGSKIPK